MENITLTVLKSKGFEDIIKAIKNKHFELAEILLMDLEADFANTQNEYTSEEIIAIYEAIEKCWKHIK